MSSPVVSNDDSAPDLEAEMCTSTAQVGEEASLRLNVLRRGTDSNRSSTSETSPRKILKLDMTPMEDCEAEAATKTVFHRSDEREVTEAVVSSSDGIEMPGPDSRQNSDEQQSNVVGEGKKAGKTKAVAVLEYSGMEIDVETALSNPGGNDNIILVPVVSAKTEELGVVVDDFDSSSDIEVMFVRTATSSGEKVINGVKVPVYNLSSPSEIEVLCVMPSKPPASGAEEGVKVMVENLNSPSEIEVLFVQSENSSLQGQNTVEIPVYNLDSPDVEVMCVQPAKSSPAQEEAMEEDEQLYQIIPANIEIYSPESPSTL